MVFCVLQRTIQAIPTLVLTSVAIFVLLRLIPGDPAVALAGADATPEVISAVRHDLGLDQPALVQYLAWLHQVAAGDLGLSIQARRPVGDLLALALPASIELVAAAMLVAVVLGGSLGVLAAVHRGHWPDLLICGVNSLLLGVPNFWLGLLAIIFFTLWLGWLPSGGRVEPAQDPGLALQSLVMPATVLGLGHAAVIARFTRAALLEALGEVYIRTARAKGLKGAAVMSRHALPNAILPVVTIVGIQIGHLLGGAVIVETVFAWPGMGRLVVGALLGRDYPVVQAVVLVLVSAFIVTNLCVDLLYGVLDPRVRAAH
jgi:peptide/nickel transport system permease protein